MLKSFFLSEKKLVYAIVRLKLKKMKDVSFSLYVIVFAMQKTDFHMLYITQCLVPHSGNHVYIRNLRRFSICCLFFFSFA